MRISNINCLDININRRPRAQRVRRAEVQWRLPFSACLGLRGLSGFPWRRAAAARAEICCQTLRAELILLARVALETLGDAF